MYLDDGTSTFAYRVKNGEISTYDTGSVESVHSYIKNHALHLERQHPGSKCLDDPK
jgi:hypothetical protein